MKKRFIANLFLPGSNGDSLRADSLIDLVPFIKSRIAFCDTNGGTLCVGDLQSKSHHAWLWKMERGKIDIAPRSKYAWELAALISKS